MARVLMYDETLKMHWQWALSGLMDATRVSLVAEVVKRDSEIRANVLKSVLLNAISLITIYAFDLFLVPLLGLNRSQLDLDEFAPQHWLHRNIGVFYTVLFQIPVVGGALYLNGTWSTVVAKRIYLLQHGRSSGGASLSGMGGASAEKVSSLLSTNAYRAVLIFTSVTLSFVLGYIPLVGGIVKFLFVCWVNSYYCFEFIWSARGFSLPERLRIEEERWAYFLAFGFPSAALCMWGSSLANAVLFALLFPAFVILAIHAQPVPQHPYAPLPPMMEGGISSPVQPSPLIPVRIPIFAAPLALHNALQDLDRFIISKTSSNASVNAGSSSWRPSTSRRNSYGFTSFSGAEGWTPETVEEGVMDVLPTSVGAGAGVGPAMTRKAYVAGSHVRGHSVNPSGDWRGMAEAARRASNGVGSTALGGDAGNGSGGGSGYGYMNTTAPVMTTRLRAKKLS